MARKKKKSDAKLFWRWVLALSAIALIMTGFAIFLKHCVMPPEPPAYTRPPEPTLTPNPYGVEDFTYDKNGYLSCLAGQSIPGIDVSSHQEVIDWAAVKASGIEFAIIRLGYRGYETGTLHVDERAAENLAGARSAGLQIGAYFFSQAISTDEALEEAEFALQVLSGTQLDLPLVYDWEYVSESARTGQLDTPTLMACVEAFCDRVGQAGYEPMIYFNQDLAKNYLELEQLAYYPFWLAMYTDRMTFPHQIRFWQYSDQGTVPGIEGDVDLDLYFP
ncbi:MAG: glycoside hydrolase family 25 protein [Oscillospiraceae bacterium]|nr:glycoside hydrolase family 25 protein [Oscillospiraceae bacterium]